MDEIKLRIKRGKEMLLIKLIRDSEQFVFGENHTLEPMNIVTPTGTSGEKLAVAYFMKNSLLLVNLNCPAYVPLHAKLRELYEFI